MRTIVALIFLYALWTFLHPGIALLGTFFVLPWLINAKTY